MRTFPPTFFDNYFLNTIRYKAANRIFGACVLPMLRLVVKTRQRDIGDR